MKKEKHILQLVKEYYEKLLLKRICVVHYRTSDFLRHIDIVESKLI